jgi:hypothetical protein
VATGSQHFLVVTNCTARKRATPSVASLPCSDARVGLVGLAKAWRKVLSAQPTGLPAGQLYVGRAMKEAKQAASQLGGGLRILSAGLGLVDEATPVPGYDLTTGRGGTHFRTLLETLGAKTSDWWHVLTDGRNLKTMLQDEPNVRVFLVAPLEYLRMVSVDLETLSRAEARRVTVVTSPAGQAFLGKRPNLLVLPYDERLESIDGFAGTRVDFPHRALRHFVQELSGHRLSPTKAIKAVEEALHTRQPRVVPARQRLDDSAICQLIHEGWDQCGGSSTRLLRYLRDDRQVACEQSRFSSLWRHVNSERPSRARSA